jgi:hypothetical protein
VFTGGQIDVHEVVLFHLRQRLVVDLLLLEQGSVLLQPQHMENLAGQSKLIQADI